MHAILMADVPPLPAHCLFTPNAQVSVDHPEIESGVEEDVPGVVVFTNGRNRPPALEQPMTK
jgi:hypothetical protein